MNKQPTKKFPRIFSLSTIGLIHHYNNDYIFHPFRTDFAGESGIGKTTIANLLQLIFVGSKAFKPVSNNAYQVSGFVLQQKDDTQQNFGYAFLNIEVSEKKYLVIGVFLKANNNTAKYFIIQNGLDKAKLTFFDKPIFHQHFFENGNRLALSELEQKSNFTCDSYSRISKYQEILFKYKILPFDLHQNEANRNKYAQILKSFSAGKDLQLSKNSTKLKEFLFGKDKIDKIKKEYEKNIEKIKNEYNTNISNETDRQEINKKGEHIKKLTKLKENKEKAEKEYYKARRGYWFFRKKNLHKDLNNEKDNLWTNKVIFCLLKREEKCKQINQTKEKITHIEKKQQELNKKINQLHKFEKIDFEKEIKNSSNRLLEAGIPYKNYTGIIKLLDVYKTVLHIQDNFDFFIKQKAISIFRSYLSGQNNKSIDILKQFNASKWAISLEAGNQAYQKQIATYDIEIKELKALKAFSNYEDKNSFVGWAMDNKKEITKYQECIIAHFYKLHIIQPESKKGNRFIWKPDTLIDILENMENIKEEVNGFWLNLNGIYEFIEFRDVYFFDRPNAKEEIKEYSKKIDIQIENITTQKKYLKELEALVQKYENRNVFSFYTKREEINSVKIEEKDEFGKINNQEELRRKIDDYENKNSLKNYEEAKKANQEIIAKEIEFSRLKEEKEKISSFLQQNNSKKHQDELKILTKEFNQITDKIALFKKENNRRFTVIDANFSFGDITNNNLIKTITELSNKVSNLEENLQEATLEYEKAEAECNLSEVEALIEELENQYTDNPEDKEKKQFDNDKTVYDKHSEILKEIYTIDSSNYEQLVKKILPAVFKNDNFKDDNIIEEVNSYLSKINDKIKEMSSMHIDFLTKRFRDVYTAYNEYNDKYKRIRGFLNSTENQITGQYQAKLTFTSIEAYPIKFLHEIQNELLSQTTSMIGTLYEKAGNKEGIERFIIKEYEKISNKKAKGDTNEFIFELLNPMNYFDMEFSITDISSNRKIEGSTGQKYASIALLCIAQMSEIYKDKTGKQPKGVRYIPVDNAGELGGNYDMLYDIARKQDFQLLTFSIKPIDDILNKNRNLYILNENLQQDRINNPPFVMLSNKEETIYKWQQYLKTNYNE